MDVQKELKEFREMNTKVAQLEAQGANSMQIRRAMQMPVKPGESDLAYQARVLIYSYASDFLQAAEAGGVELSLTAEDAELVAQVLGISQAGAYDLLHSEGFPVLKIGTRMVVPKEKFRQWVEDHTRPES